MKRNHILLTVLLLLLTLLIVNNMRKGEVRRLSELTYKTGRSKGRHGGGPALPVLNKELITIKREKFRMGKKGIFDPLRYPEKKPPPPPPPAPPEPPPPAPVVEEKTPMEKAVARFTFLGFLESGRKKTIFLSGESDVFVVKEGGEFGFKYVAKKITDNVMIVTTKDGSETLEISLVENAPLTKR